MANGYGKFSTYTGKTNEDIVRKTIAENISKLVDNNEYVIFDDFVYLPGKDRKEVIDIVENNFVEVENLLKENNQTITSQLYSEIRKILKKIFFQTYTTSKSTKFTSFLTKKQNNQWDYKSDKVDVNVVKKFTNEDYEMLNFIVYEYEINYKNKNLTFNDYLCGLRVKSYGIAKNIKSSFVFKSNQSLEGWEIDKFISQLIAPDETWKKSSLLSAEQIAKSNILSGKEYTFYTESSSLYQSIFNDVAKKINSTNLFDEYFRNLNVNKYFISDILAVEKNSNCISIIKNRVDRFYRNPSLLTLKKLFSTMDNYFSTKEFIPISLKQIQSYSNKRLDKNTITKEQVISSLIKVINPPNLEEDKKFNGIKLDDFDLLLLDLINRSKNSSFSFDKEFKQILKIRENSFKYSIFIKTKSYGGITYNTGNYKNVYFEFDLNIDSDKKTYMFELSNNLKIRTKGSASATGEGTINTQSLNYVINEIYKGKYSSEISKLVNRRKRNLPKPNTAEEKNYNNIMSKNELITPSLRFDRKATQLKTILSNPTNQSCINHFIQYYKDLSNNTSNIQITDNKEAVTLMGKVCGLELGLLLDKNIEVDASKEIVKVTLDESEKSKIISSIWGLLSGRGPIEFERVTFRSASSIQDVLKYQIKFPALVKIGI